MARIKIGDLPKNQRVSKQEMNAVMGGQDRDHKSWSDFMGVIGPGGCPHPIPLFAQQPQPDPDPPGLDHPGTGGMVAGRGGR